MIRELGLPALGPGLFREGALAADPSVELSGASWLASAADRPEAGLEGLSFGSCSGPFQLNALCSSARRRCPYSLHAQIRPSTVFTAFPGRLQGSRELEGSAPEGVSDDGHDRRRIVSTRGRHDWGLGWRVVPNTPQPLTVETKEVAHVTGEERVQVESLGEGVYRLTLSFGFMDEPCPGPLPIPKARWSS